MTHLILVAALTAGVMTAAEPLRFADRHIFEKDPTCAGPKEVCVYAEFKFVEAVSGPAAVRTRINDAIRAYLAEDMEVKLAPAELAKYMVESSKEQQGNDPKPWYDSETITILRTGPRVISLKCTQRCYAGGHDAPWIVYLNFDAATGEPLKLSDILRDKALPRLKAVAEAHLRKLSEQAPKMSLEEMGIGFPNELNDNFGLTNKTITFTFNECEIGPCVYGPILIEIPLREIRNLLRPGLLH